MLLRNMLNEANVGVIKGGDGFSRSGKIPTPHDRGGSRQGTDTAWPNRATFFVAALLNGNDPKEK